MAEYSSSSAVNMVSTNCNGYIYCNEQVPQNAPTVSLPLNGPNPVVISLNDEKKLWSKYCGLPNEMMVLTTGRELFPKLKYDVKGLYPDIPYTITIFLQRKCDYFMKYEEGEWKESSKPIDAPECTNYYTVGTMSGKDWMAAGINAEHLKIYNIGNPKKVGGKPVDPNDRLAAVRAAEKAQKLRETLAMSIEIKSLTKYLPILTIWQILPDGTLREVQWFSAAETQFLTCTGYKNPLVRTMKSNDNKYVPGLPSNLKSPSPVVTAAPFQMDGQVMAASTSDVVRWDPDSPTNSSGYSSDRTSYSPEFVPVPSTHHYVPTPAPHHYVPTPTPYHPIPYPPAQPDLYYSHVPFESFPEDQTHMLFHY
ncbi:unnamed protein product [Caenorhabditis sp. 36 PRJEB53466]|nr:unnamed protein product [Caenorhabditis sp. 36 PRJEB53466]